MVRHLPNFLTLCNLFCGCIGMVAVADGHLVKAGYLIGAAAIFDFLDGFAARLLRATSPIGKDLDSLADMVTFGVLPSFIIYRLLQQALTAGGSGQWLAGIAFMIAVFSALRLARFNHDVRQTDRFIGLPTPANALLIASLPMIAETGTLYAGWLDSAVFLLVFTIAVSFLLVAELPLMALKFSAFGWKGNEVRYNLILVSVLLLVFLKIVAVPVIMVIYLGVSWIVFRAERR